MTKREAMLAGYHMNWKTYEYGAFNTWKQYWCLYEPTTRQVHKLLGEQVIVVEETGHRMKAAFPRDNKCHDIEDAWQKAMKLLNE